MTKKQKIINDPVHGFINIPAGLIADIIEHPYFQRLREIKQLGLSYLVYPGACHTRFQHAIGAMHLMHEAINVLRSKGNEITDQEAEAAQCAILMHDLGHGPFSHSLEYSIADDIEHEYISYAMMQKMNDEFGGQLSMAIEIFSGKYHKKFLTQLVSSQLDVDRLDYLTRDSFFSGVAEGMIGLARIINMLNVAGDELVVEAKGIYSVEKFLISRHLMYWQVYLHKTVLAAENMLIKTLARAKELSRAGQTLFASPALQFFLKNVIKCDDFSRTVNGILPMQQFSNLTDCDIESAIKVWCGSNDFVLATLSQMIVARKLPRCVLSDKPFEQNFIDEIRSKTKKYLKINDDDLKYFVVNETVSNKAYTPQTQSIKILYGNGTLVDISEVSAMLTAAVFSAPTTKYELCYLKQIFD